MKLENLRLSSNEKYTLISNFTTMFNAGIPILEVVESLLDGSKGNQKKLLETMHADLTQGNHIYTTFAKFPRIFDIVTVNIIKASEQAGTLDVALNDLKDYIKKETEFSDKLKSAMIYPIFIVGVFVAVLLMILVVVVPKISTVFLRLHVELPLPTKILITMSNILLTYTPAVIAGAVVLGFMMWYVFRAYKMEVLNALFSLPYLSKLAKEIDLTKFTHSMYLLLNAGIPINTALELTIYVVLKRDVYRAIKNAKDAVISGKRLSEGFKGSSGTIPVLMIKIIEAGEKSGSLDKSMQDISEYFDYQVSASLKIIIALLEPVMLVAVGILVGGMMLAIIAPIYGLIGQVGPR
jgi:type IV pilus assembly protein PilC